MAASPAELHTVSGSLSLWMALVPMMAAGPVYAVASRSRVAGYLSVLAGMVSVGIGLALLPQVVHGPLEASIRAMGYGISVRADAFGMGMALFAALGWTLAMVFSLDYMSHGQRLPRYWAFMLFTMGATLGVFLAGDLFSLFVFFELMTFASYLLVVHEETPEAMAAGGTFLYMGVIGGLCLIFAIIILDFVAGTSIDHSVAAKVLGSGYFTLVTLMALAGFGVKAGMVPIHIWLPQAHPVAPAPASAVLSGVLIKAGAYGIIRIFLMVLGPWEHGHSHALFQNGAMLLGIGLLTMVMGGIMALFQANAKRILAYSSISQMGYILTGVGAAAVLGMEGPMGFGGAFYHMMNHVVFKAAAFMVVGYVYMATHELDVTKVSGLWRQMPVAALTFVACFGAITGLPGFSGFASKTMIHHALVEAYHETHLVSILWAERVFVAGSALTAVYFLRLGGLFFGKVRVQHAQVRVFPLASVALASLATLIVLVGAFPGFLLDNVVFPAAEGFGFEHHALEHLHHLEFFLWSDIRGVVIPLVLGLSIYVVGARAGLFRFEPPGWISVEGLVYRPLSQVALNVAVALGLADPLIDGFYRASCRLVHYFVSGVAGVDKCINEFFLVASGVASAIVNKTGVLDHKLNEGYVGASLAVMDIVSGTNRLDRGIDGTYLTLARRAKEALAGLDEAPGPEGSPAGRVWSPWNLNLGVLLLALTLAILTVVFVISGTFW